jgi:hypothetical protein
MHRDLQAGLARWCIGEVEPPLRHEQKGRAGAGIKRGVGEIARPAVRKSSEPSNMTGPVVRTKQIYNAVSARGFSAQRKCAALSPSRREPRRGGGNYRRGPPGPSVVQVISESRAAKETAPAQEAFPSRPRSRGLTKNAPYRVRTQTKHAISDGNDRAAPLARARSTPPQPLIRSTLVTRNNQQGYAPPVCRARPGGIRSRPNPSRVAELSAAACGKAKLACDQHDKGEAYAPGSACAGDITKKPMRAYRRRLV